MPYLDYVKAQKTTIKDEFFSGRQSKIKKGEIYPVYHINSHGAMLILDESGQFALWAYHNFLPYSKKQPLSPKDSQ